MLLSGFLPAAALLAVLAALGLRNGIPLEVLTRDPLAVAGRQPYVGFLSNFGVLLWCAAASACFLASAVGGRSRHGAFLFCSGALSALLMLDDLFMLHEDVFPKRLGLSERRVYAVYGILAIAYLVAFARTILATRWRALPLTAVCFGVSVAIDAEWFGHRCIFAEDAAKFLGIAGWCTYLCSTCAAALRSPLPTTSASELPVDAVPGTPPLDPPRQPSNGESLQNFRAARGAAWSGSRDRRGAAIVYGVVVMAVAMALCSLAVDYGRAQLVRTELQSCVDGAARAAAGGLGTDLAEARQRARDLAILNRANGTAVTFADGDFRFGRWNASTTQLDVGATPIDAVELTARRDVSLTFGSMFGKDNVPVAARATARAQRGGGGLAGFVGLNGIEFKNNAFIGSYKSSTNKHPVPASSTGKGVVSSNATVQFWNNAVVSGDVILGPSGNEVHHNNLSVTGATLKNANAFVPPADPAWTPAPNPGGIPQNYTVNSNATLPGGTYWFTSLRLNKRLTFAGPAVVYVNGNIWTDDEIVTYLDTPSNLKIYQLGNNRTMDFQTDIVLHAEVQAPGSALIGNNKMYLHGAGIWKTIEAKNNVEFYYDLDAPSAAAGGTAASGITLVK